MAAPVLLLSATGAIFIFHALSRFRSFRRNVAEAAKSGLPFVTQPWDVYAVLWLATYSLWLPLIRKLPAACHGLWMELLDPEWAYRLGHRPFAQIGSDVFLVVSPRKIKAFVADADVITQITTRRNDFPKPLRMYRRLDIYGKNLVSTEGSDWRTHRKLTASCFGEKNNELIFNESLHHAQEMLKVWTGPDGNGNKTIKEPAKDVMRFALYIISRAGFNVRVVWPHEEKTEISTDQKSVEESKLSFTGSTPPPGHKMNYRQALSSLLENIMWTQLAPPAWLTKSPFKVHKETGAAVIEWGEYMNKIYESKREEVASGDKDKDGGMDLFHAMIRGSGILDPSKTTDLQKSDLLGNAFVLMLAGHETTANAIHFSLLYLAMNWPSQKRLQESIDKALGEKPISSWTYEEDFPKLFDAMPAAVMNETLRLLQPIINIPKSTLPGRPQPIYVEGRECLMPADVHIGLSSAVHRNPKYWPSLNSPEKSSIGTEKPDIDTFRPERWLTTPDLSNGQGKENGNGHASEESSYDDPSLTGPSGADTSSHLFKPVRGSYIPFSEGYRSCIGRRFAQVEILAAFAVIFSQYSVELAVDEWASDAEIESMGGEDKKKVWNKARDKADWLLSEKMQSMITLQLREDTVPVRIVRRGSERFAWA